MQEIALVSIYVSHHSDKFINKFGARHKEELGRHVLVINSSVANSCIDDSLDFQVIDVGKNIGFAAANNIAIDVYKNQSMDYFMFINPDVYLLPSWLKTISPFLKDDSNKDVGIFTVPLLSYSFNEDRETGYIDSLGVYNTWYGRWYDYLAGKGVSFFNKDDLPYDVPAACGAMMIVRGDVVKSLLQEDGYVFNESFFMYKEDIELSARVRKLGRTIMMLPSAPAFHCRGWDGNRGSSYWRRKLSARNELSMNLKYFWRYIPYSLLKYVYVKWLEKK